jgi:hypothetical protein
MEFKSEILYISGGQPVIRGQGSQIDAPKIDLLTLKQSFELLHKNHKNKERRLEHISWLIENNVPQRNILGSLPSLSENLEIEELFGIPNP